MTSVLTPDLYQYACGIFRSMLALELEPIEEDADPITPITWAGCVQISGAFDGGVVLRCGSHCAEYITAAMFQLGEGTPEDEDIRDVIGEIANMVAGNVKAHLPRPSSLNVPTVVHGEGAKDLAMEGRIVARAAGKADGKLVFFSLFAAV